MQKSWVVPILDFSVGFEAFFQHRYFSLSYCQLNPSILIKKLYWYTWLVSTICS